MRQSETVPRAERAATAQALRSEGLFYREIAERMGLSKQYVAELVTDPEGKQVAARKLSYRKPCPNCGEISPASGHDGKYTPSRLCDRCSKAERHANRHWTADRIIEWIQAYVAEHGKIPSSAVLVTDAVGFGTNTVRREFGDGCWPAAIRAAGFEPRRRYDGSGQKLGADHPKIVERIRLYQQGVSKAEIARRQGVTEAAISFTIARHLEGKTMGSRVTPTAVLEREKDRAEQRIQKLRAEIEEEEQNKAGLDAALQALAAHRNGNGSGK